MVEYKLYKVSYVNGSTEQYFCEDVIASDNPEKLKADYESNPDNEHVEVKEFKLEGFKITVEKVDK